MKDGGAEFIPSIVANGEFELSTDIISKRRISFYVMKKFDRNLLEYCKNLK